MASKDNRAPGCKFKYPPCTKGCGRAAKNGICSVCRRHQQATGMKLRHRNTLSPEVDEPIRLSRLDHYRADVEAVGRGEINGIRYVRPA